MMKSSVTKIDFTHSLPHFSVHFASGLVQHDDLRLSDQCSDDADGVLLSVRQFVPTVAQIWPESGADRREASFSTVSLQGLLDSRLAAFLCLNFKFKFTTRNCAYGCVFNVGIH